MTRFHHPESSPIDVRALVDSPAPLDAWRALARDLVRQGKPFGRSVLEALDGSLEGLGSEVVAERVLAARRVAIASGSALDPRLVLFGHVPVDNLQSAYASKRMGSRSFELGWDTLSELARATFSVERVWPVFVEGEARELHGRLPDTTHVAIHMDSVGDPWDGVSAMMRVAPALRVLRVHTTWDWVPAAKQLADFRARHDACRLEWETGSFPDGGPSTLPTIAKRRSGYFSVGRRIGRYVCVEHVAPTRRGPIWQAFDTHENRLVRVLGPCSALVPSGLSGDGRRAWLTEAGILREEEIEAGQWSAGQWLYELADSAAVVGSFETREGVGSADGLTWAASTSAAIRNGINHDGWVASKDFFAVIDVCPGSHAADQVTASLCNVFAGPGTVREKLQSADDLLTGEVRPRLEGCTAHVSVVSIAKNDRCVASLGLDLVYRLRANRLERLTPDTSVAQVLLARGKLSRDDPAFRRLRNTQSRALVTGGRGYSSESPFFFEITDTPRTLQIQRGDRFLLSTSQALTEGELWSVLAETSSPMGCVARIIAETRRCDPRRDVTAIVIDVVD